jgi:hypothetical protein
MIAGQLYDPSWLTYTRLAEEGKTFTRRRPSPASILRGRSVANKPMIFAPNRRRISAFILERVQDRVEIGRGDCRAMH